MCLLKIQESVSSQIVEFSLSNKMLILVGRGKKNNIIFPVRMISRFHCFLFLKDDTDWYVQDGNFYAVNGDPDQWSTNGTFLNGELIKKKFDLFKLMPRDIITFGTGDRAAYPQIIFHQDSDKDKDKDTDNNGKIAIEHEYE